MNSEATRPLHFRSTVAALSVGQLVGWAALYYAFSAFVLPMHAAMGWSKPEIMGAFTVGLAAWGASSYAAGVAIDRGHDRALMSWGAALAGAGFLLWSQVSALWMLYLAWVMLGASMSGCLYESAFGTVTKRFPAQYPKAITTLTLAGGFASTLCFPSVAWLIGAWGWRWALAVIGLVLLLGVAPLYAWALRHPVSSVARLAAHTQAHVANTDATLHEALRQRNFWLLTLTFTLYAFISAALWAHIMPAITSKGLDEKSALWVLAWIGPSQVLGRLLYMGGARWISQRTLGLVVFAGLPASLALFALADQLVVLLVFAFLFGVVNGLVTIVRGNLVPEYFGRSHVGRISGAMLTIGLVWRAAAPLATAWLLLVVAGYREVLLVLSALGVGAWLAYASARR